MKIRVEANGRKIGVDNEVTKAFETGNWAVRLIFTNDNNDGRFEVSVDEEEIPSFISQLEFAMLDIRKIKDVAWSK